MSDIRLEITALRWREQLLQKYSYTTRSPFDGCRNEMETEERRRGGGRRGVGGVHVEHRHEHRPPNTHPVCQNKDSSRNKKQYQEEPGLNKRTMDNNGNCT